MNKKEIFERYGKILIPLVTPFKENQELDFEAVKQITDKIIAEDKADSLVVSGTTGEFFSMTFEERKKLFEVVFENVGDELGLVAGTACVSTRETIELSKAAENIGYKLLMIVAPYYTKPNQKEIYEHYRSIAEEINVSIILYNIPIFTGVNIDPATVKELAKYDNIVGIKEEAELNPKQITEFLNITPDDFVIYNGDDTMVIESYAQGGEERVAGVISGASHIIGHKIRNLIELYTEGKTRKAASLQQDLLPLFRAFGQNKRTNPVALLKEAMKLVGYDAGYPRKPLLPGSEKEIEQVKEVLKNLQVI